MILADRYRIIGLLGRGGMGEVYRADDLKLGQPVALKFLPKALADDPVRRERFYAEVRIARQVSHPNICRVYDIAEIEGRHFLTMEYVDGEDLASLLKRIGSLHGTKALDIARQLCAGLAAAHDKGVLHRDLKPANVMIDGRGAVRITDFGLAVAAGEDTPAGEVSGTPIYMAPEQLAGKGASVRSDIYALGLVLYEVYTGKRAFEAKSLAELRAKKEGVPPTAPSEMVRDMDPVVDRLILRCLEKDPRQRPASAAQVAAALPGGNPLAAALAAGETPSPEMVAASGGREGLRPWIAWACLGFVALGIAAAAVLGRHALLYQRVRIQLPPEALVVKAREILAQAGYSQPFADSLYGFVEDTDYLRHVRTSDRSAKRWEWLPDSTIRFWYRQSPTLIEHLRQSITPGPFDPPPYFADEVHVWLDARGRLLSLSVIPPLADGSDNPSRAPDWSVLFGASGFDPARWTAVEPQWAPPVFGDARAAWTGALPDRPGVPMRIEAAAFRGKPVTWDVIAPWTPAPRILASEGGARMKAVNLLLLIVVLATISGGTFFARRNLRLGRGDRRAAARLSYLFIALRMAEWVLGEHHLLSPRELYSFANYLGPTLGLAALLWGLYIAVEPYVRRRWPACLISWSRMLAGEFRDPLAGRDLLIGCMAGAAAVFLGHFGYTVTSWAGAPQPEPLAAADSHYFIMGARAVLAAVCLNLYACLFLALACLFMLILLRTLVRNDWAAMALLILIFSAIWPIWQYSSASATDTAVPWITGALAGGLAVAVLMRFGLLALAAAFVFQHLLLGFPVTTQPSTWYWETGLAGVFLLLALAGYAFYTSLGGQPVFGRASVEGFADK
jgi:serine/threonine-protein kinase